MNNGTKKRQLQGLLFISYVDNLFFNGHMDREAATK